MRSRGEDDDHGIAKASQGVSLRGAGNRASAQPPAFDEVASLICLRIIEGRPKTGDPLPETLKGLTA